MTNLIAPFNTLADGWSTLALTMFVQSSLVILVLLLLDWALRRRVRAAVRYGLLLLVLAKLVLPPGWASPSALAYWLRPASELRANPAGGVARVTVREVEATLAQRDQADSPGVASSPGLTWPALFTGLWGMGALTLLGVLLRRSIKVRRIVAESVEAPSGLQRLHPGHGGLVGRAGNVRIRVSDHLSSPALCGLLRPTILIPSMLADRLSVVELRAILIHELTHVARGDLWVNHLQTLLQIVYWWHPLVWVANTRLRQVREEAVDDAVRLALADEAHGYPATLLEVAKAAMLRPTSSLGFLGIFESRSRLSRRVRRLLEEPAPRRATVGWSGVAAVVVIGGLLLPMAQAERNAPVVPAKGEPAHSEGMVLLDCHLIEMSAEVFRQINLAPPLIGSRGEQIWVLPGPEAFDPLLRKFTTEPDARVVARPRLVTTSGTTGTISVTRATNVHGRPIQLGTVCQLTQVLEGSEVDLAIHATLTELDPGNSAGYRQRLVADTRRKVPMGGGVLILQGSTADSEERLVFMVRTDTPEKFQLGNEDLPDPSEVEPPAAAEVLPGGDAVPNTAEVPQIMIEVKFIEAPESLVASLPIGRALVPPGSTNQARSLSETEFRQLLRQLEETPGVDLMAAPRVTTLSGRQAQIQIVEIKSGVSRVPAGDNTATSPAIESVPVGPTLDVIPRVTEHGDAFDLLVLASVNDLVGHIEPGSSHYVPAGAAVAAEGAPLPLPVFRERPLTTRVILPRGQTLLLMEGSPAADTTGTGPAPAGTAQPGRRLLVLMTPWLVTETGRPVAPQVPAP